MAARQFVVTAAAEIVRMAGCASCAVNRRILPVQVVCPARGVRCGPHHLMTRKTLEVWRRFWRNSSVAQETLGFRRSSLIRVVLAETLVVRRRFDVARMARRNRASLVVNVAELAVAHAKFRRQNFGSLMATHTVNLVGQSNLGEAVAGGHVRVASRAVHGKPGSRFIVLGVREFNIGVTARIDVHSNPLMRFG